MSGRCKAGQFALCALLWFVAGCSGSSARTAGLEPDGEQLPLASPGFGGTVDLVRSDGPREERAIESSKTPVSPVEGLPLGGILVNASGHPLPGVELLVLVSEELTGFIGSEGGNRRVYAEVPYVRKRLVHCRSGGAGEFLAEGLEPGSYGVLTRDPVNRHWRNLAEPLLAAGKEDHVVILPSRRLRVRVVQTDGTFVPFDPRIRPKAKLEDGVWKPLGEALRVAFGPAVPVRGPQGSFHDFGDGSGPPPLWYETGDHTVWEVSVPHGEFVLLAESLVRPVVQMRVAMPSDIDFMERVLQLPDACEPGLLVVEASDPSGGQAIPEFAIRFGRELGPELQLPGSFPRSMEAAAGALRESFLLAPGSYSVTLEPMGLEDSSAVPPAGVTRSFTLAPGGLAQLVMDFEVRSCVRLLSRGRPNDGPLHLVDRNSGEIVHVHHYGGSQESHFMGYPEVFLRPGSYRLEGRIGAKGYSLDFELAPERAVYAGWWHKEGAGWNLQEVQVDFRD